MNLVIDSSVAIKWFLPEPGSDAAEKLLSGVDRYFAPDLLRLEVGNVLLRAVRRGALTRQDSTRALDWLNAPNIDLVATSNVFDIAFNIAGQYGGSLYDACYLALAKTLNAEIVTADLQMIAIARKAKVRAQLLA